MIQQTVGHQPPPDKGGVGLKGTHRSRKIERHIMSQDVEVRYELINNADCEK